MKKLAIVGGNISFYKFIELAFSGEIVHFKSMEDAGKAALSESYEAIIALAEPGELLPMLSLDGLKVYTKLWNDGQKVYAEMCDLQDGHLAGLFGFRVYGFERAVYTENFIWQDSILQAPKASYQPGMACAGEVLIRAQNCIGSHTPVIANTESFPILVSNQSFLYSATRLSVMDRLTMLPNGRWKALFAEIFAGLLGEEKERIENSFEKVWPPMRLAGATNDIQQAVKRAVGWHFHSGIMTDVSGVNGCYEMIRSGSFSVKNGQRVDVMLLTAALLCTAGRAMKESSWEQVGRNLADHCLDAGLQIAQGPNRGIFRWFDSFGGNRRAYCYASDNGRDGMAMLQLYRVTGKKCYLEAVKQLGDAYLRWADGEAYLKATAFDINECDLEHMERSKSPANAPVYYDGMAIVLANLYRITGEQRYKDQLKLTADAMLRDYPNYATNFTPLTMNFVYSRLIIVLCAAQEIGCGDYSGLINELLTLFETLQDPCGGVQDFGLIMDDNTYTDEEFAVSMGKQHDKIVDMLYCTNNLLGCFSIICSMRNPITIQCEKARRMRKEMLSLLLEIQITESDARLHGGWMRAYDMENKEYYGVNKDLGWGPYCIMGGWMMGFYPLLLLEEEGAPSIYSIVENKCNRRGEI